jgi:hypothetical protein
LNEHGFLQTSPVQGRRVLYHLADGDGERTVKGRDRRLTVISVGYGAQSSLSVMAGLVPATHALLRRAKNVDARDKPGHDE